MIDIAIAAVVHADVAETAHVADTTTVHVTAEPHADAITLDVL